MDPASTAPVPNHHAGHPGFSGVGGLLIGVTMVVGGGRMARLAAELARPARGDHVVDVGCGPGTAARVAARRGAAVTGVDPAVVMLSLARRLTRRGVVIAWTDGTAESLPLPDGSATIVWSLASVHHWPDLHQGLAEVRRVLAVGGRWLAVERKVRPTATGLASHGWTLSQANAFAQLCRDAGFGDVSVEPRRHRRRSWLAVKGEARA